MDTRDIGPLCQPGQPLYNIEVSNGGLITFGGGVLLKNAAGVVVGAVGVGTTLTFTTIFIVCHHLLEQRLCCAPWGLRVTKEGVKIKCVRTAKL